MPPKLNLNKFNLIAPCGLYCGECSGFQFSQCGGCVSRKGLCLKYTKICKIYDCCAAKQLKFCNECKEFPCDKLATFFNTSVWYDEVVGNLRQLKKLGLTQFLKKQVKRVEELIECAIKHKVIHCSKCKEWPCKRLKREPLTPA